MAIGHGTILKLSMLDLFTLLANGRTYKEIAAEHGMNMHTIHSRIQRFKQANGFRNTTHAVAILVKKGRITIRE